MHTKTMTLISSAISAALLCGCSAISVNTQQKVENKQAAAPAKKEAPKAGNYTFSVKTDKPNAIYKKGETITFTLQLMKDNAPVNGVKIEYRTTVNGNYEPKMIAKSDKPIAVTKKLDKPGWVSITASAFDANGKPLKEFKNKNRNLKAEIGAMVDPLEIMESAPEPIDFDLFWKSQRETLNTVPVKATRTKVNVPQQYQGKVVCYDVQVDCAGAAPVSGYLAMPENAKKGSLPAIVLYHGAGVRSSGKSVGYGKKAIAFDVNAHGLPNGQPNNFYNKLSKGKLKGYPHFEKDNRDKFYFKDMFLRVMRALDYVKTLPEWNGKVLIVKGGSQGGGQAIVAAALDPQVTLCFANVPAIGDHAGRLVGRKPGWPGLVTSQKPNDKEMQIIKTGGYFDHNYFAKRIKCETYMGTGFLDFTCSPVSVYAAYNNLPKKTKKFIQTTPAAGHGAPLNIGDKRINQILGK